MPISMHDVAAPSFTKGLDGLARTLAKGAAHAAETGTDPASYLAARLAPDMFALPRQVQIATDHAKGAMCRLSGREVPKWEDTKATFPELIARVERTAALVASVTSAEFEGAETRTFELRIGQQAVPFVGLPYLVGFALPNFWFHVTTAYDILRMAGVPVGKRDFLAL